MHNDQHCLGIINYKAIWNVGKVLNHLTTMEQVTKLSLKDLILKLTMLVC